MIAGASTSCFYPLETEKALDEVIALDFKKAEIFFNTSSELEDDFVKEMKKKADANGTKIISVHPFSSALENNCIFGEYQRRYDDFIGLYQKHCHAAALLGADILVIHGGYANLKRPLPDEHYFERFASLVEIGKKEGVRVCQENVVKFRSQDIDFLKRMKRYLGNDFNMVFDIKQAIRCGYDPFVILEEFKNDIVHVHMSDNTSNNDCLPPGKGDFDFDRLFKIMKSVNYEGNYIIELYSLGLNIKEELKQSKCFLEQFK